MTKTSGDGKEITVGCACEMTVEGLVGGDRLVRDGRYIWNERWPFECADRDSR